VSTFDGLMAAGTFVGLFWCPFDGFGDGVRRGLLEEGLSFARAQGFDARVAFGVDVRRVVAGACRTSGCG